MPKPRVPSGQKTSPGKASRKPVSSVMKKVRMTEDEARGLASLAKGLGKTESDVLREGILLVRAQEERDDAIEELIRMLQDGKEGSS